MIIREKNLDRVPVFSRAANGFRVYIAERFYFFILSISCSTARIYFIIKRKSRRQPSFVLVPRWKITRRSYCRRIIYNYYNKMNCFLRILFRHFRSEDRPAAASRSRQRRRPGWFCSFILFWYLFRTSSGEKSFMKFAEPALNNTTASESEVGILPARIMHLSEMKISLMRPIVTLNTHYSALAKGV